MDTPIFDPETGSSLNKSARKFIKIVKEAGSNLKEMEAIDPVRLNLNADELAKETAIYKEKVSNLMSNFSNLLSEIGLTEDKIQQLISFEPEETVKGVEEL